MPVEPPDRQADLARTFREAEQAGLRIAIKGRLVALVRLGAFLVVSRISNPEHALVLGLGIAGFAALGPIHYPLIGSRHDRPWLKYAFLTLDIAELAAKERFDGEQLAVRAGVATGPVIAGSVGGGGRQSYSLYGDTVNLAARLEALNKEFGTQVLIDAATVARLDDFPVQEIGRVPVRGFSEPAAVFAPVPETGAKLGLGPGPAA